MNYQQTTQIPNYIFDIQLAELSHSELKILLYILRKTNGFITKNGSRKKRDRIAYSQFIKATGISRRSLPPTIQSLILKKHITVTDYYGNLLDTPALRKGKTGIFYSPLQKTNAKRRTRVCKQKYKPVQIGLYNKTKQSKLKETKSNFRISDYQRLEEILKKKRFN